MSLDWCASFSFYRMSLVSPETVGRQHGIQHVYVLETKLEDLRGQQAEVGILCNSAKELLQCLGNQDARCCSEFQSHIEILEGFQNDVASIEVLRGRLDAEKKKVEDYNERIQRVQVKIKRHHQKESVKGRATCRLLLRKIRWLSKISKVVFRESKIILGVDGCFRHHVVVGNCRHWWWVLHRAAARTHKAYSVTLPPNVWTGLSQSLEGIIPPIPRVSRYQDYGL